MTTLHEAEPAASLAGDHEPAHSGTTAEPASPVAEPRSDDEITADVLSLLWYRSDLPQAELSHLQVRTRDGIVDLLGRAPDSEAAAAIEALVPRVRGVRGVRNLLKTLGPRARPTPAASTD